MESGNKYSLLSRLNPDDLLNTFWGMDQRQQILTVVGLFAILILILVMPISCAGSKLGELDSDFEKIKEGQQNLMKKIAEYQSSKAQLALLQKNYGSNSGSMTTIMESIAKEIGIDQNIKHLKPSRISSTDFYDEEGVDLVISNITISQLTEFLHHIENYKEVPLKIKKMQIKTNYRSREELNATIKVSTLKLKEEEA